MEDYLEAIFHIVAEKGAARAKDIAKRLKVNHSSVTGALKALSGKELVNYAPYDVVTLTPRGKDVAEDVIRRHEVLKEFFTKVLAVDEAVAEEGACGMEHSVPRTILERLTRYIEYVDACPRGGTKWVEGFGYFCDHGEIAGTCEKCLAESFKEVVQKEEEGG